MNKKIVAISILLLMMCAMAASVFAEENNYQVVVVYYTRGIRSRSGEWLTRPERQEKVVVVTASSVSDAEEKAKNIIRNSENCGEIRSANAVKL